MATMSSSYFEIIKNKFNMLDATLKIINDQMNIVNNAKKFTNNFQIQILKKVQQDKPFGTNKIGEPSLTRRQSLLTKRVTSE